MNQLWFEKYRPKNLSDILLSSNDLKVAKEWITNFKNKKEKTPNCLFLYGEPGTGKTSLAKVLLEENGYDTCEFNASELRNGKQIRDSIEEINGNMNVLNMMFSKKKPMAIIMDEIDGMNSSDKGGLTELMSIMFKNKTKKNKHIPNGSPFICISNSLDKKLKMLRDKSVSIKVLPPNKILLKKLSERILKNENIDIDYIELNKVISHCQNDYRRLVNILEFLFYNVKTNQEIENVWENIDKLLKNFEKKSEKNNGYESVSMFLNNSNLELDTYYTEYYNNPSLINLLLFENVPNTIIKNRKGNKDDKIKTLSEIFKKFSDTDKYETAFYTMQKWDLQDYLCSERVIETNRSLNSLERYSVNRDNNINYSKMLNKISLEHSHVKVLDFYNVYFTNYHTECVYYIVGHFIIVSLINDFDNTIKFLKDLKITYDSLEKKVFKIINKSELISVNLKKEISSALVY